MMASARPGGVTLVAVLTWISGAINIIVGVLGLFPGGQDFWSSLLQIVLGIIVVSVARGLLRGSNLSRIIITIVQAIAVIAAIVGLFTGPNWSAVIAGIVPAIVLILLWTGRANEFFKD
jgi:hypothetical protein